MHQDELDFKVIKLEACLQSCLAQLAEIKALRAAYVHGVWHMFGAVGKQKGFEKSNGDPMQS